MPINPVKTGQAREQYLGELAQTRNNLPAETREPFRFPQCRPEPRTESSYSSAS